MSFVEQNRVVVLNNGKKLYNHCGKYRSNLTFIWKGDEPLFERSDFRKFNLAPDGTLSELRGRFWVSPKGTHCFEVDPKGPHLLLKCGWGGAFDKSRGDLPIANPLYERRSSSTGGGLGASYWVVPVGWRYSLSEEDL